MKKRLLAMLLAAAMICSFMPNVVLAEGEPAVTAHDGSNHKCEHCNATVTWEAWGDTDAEKKSLPKGTADQTTHYYLVSNVTVTGRTEMTNKADVVICLNGHTIDGDAKDTIFRVGGTAKLTITDCTAYTDAEGVYHAGRIQNGKNTGGVAGGFYVYNNAQLTMHAGVIANNRNLTTNVKETDDAYSGGGIHVRNSGKVVLNNVWFVENTSAREGGAICMRDATSTLIANGCTFQGNTAGIGNSVTLGGGAIYAKAGNITLKDCTFGKN